jgi:hypothetical protein
MVYFIRVVLLAQKVNFWRTVDKTPSECACFVIIFFFKSHISLIYCFYMSEDSSAAANADVIFFFFQKS